MLSLLCKFIFKKPYRRFIKNNEKTKAYRSNLGTWETRLNDETRMLINSIRGSVDAEKFINRTGNINTNGFISYVKQRYPHFYNSDIFKEYNKQVTHLQGKIRYEKQVINKFTRYYNEDIHNHPILAKIWGFESIPYETWNEGRNVQTASMEYNNTNQQHFREHYNRR